ncbi:hypothetical protein [Corynebacterium comes]|uniref:Uncharacterized protein n=1 Tax=Corynebacterium comes TaxID=2675218 RepID=A0A6B8W1B6_9CORY|nr:hypothetical protein [Corynebacterium comes]QGU04736.1 hypothetical protein CETAM_07375 [Corynebacterium comes]
MDLILQELLIEPWRIPVIITSAAGIYLGFLVSPKIFGTRVLMSLTASAAPVWAHSDRCRP